MSTLALASFSVATTRNANMYGLRLLDMRTPSDHDATYRDPFQPYNPSNALLVYGTQRFVAAGATEPAVRIFDFRYPKPYYHSDALPCSGYQPTPAVESRPRLQGACG